MIEIIEVDCYFVVLNFNCILLKWEFCLMFIFHVIYKMYCSSILKFCTQYNQCEHNGFVSVWV
jgi:hypothetical protein